MDGYPDAVAVFEGKGLVAFSNILSSKEASKCRIFVVNVLFLLITLFSFFALSWLPFAVLFIN